MTRRRQSGLPPYPSYRPITLRKALFRVLILAALAGVALQCLGVPAVLYTYRYADGGGYQTPTERIKTSGEYYSLLGQKTVRRCNRDCPFVILVPLPVTERCRQAAAWAWAKIETWRH